MTKLRVLQLQHGVDIYHLMASESEQEQQWVESELKAWLL